MKKVGYWLEHGFAFVDTEIPREGRQDPTMTKGAYIGELKIG